MGRFIQNRGENIVPTFGQFPPNPKVAIPRHPSQIVHDTPLRIAPKPVDQGNGQSGAHDTPTEMRKGIKDDIKHGEGTRTVDS